MSGRPQRHDVSKPTALATIPAARSPSFLLRGQLLHAGAAVLLGVVAWAFAAPAFGDGRWLGATDRTWFLVALAVPVVHQGYVWLAFRGQLGWGLLTRAFGERDLTVHALLFTPLLVARPLVVVAVGLADPSSLLLPRWLELAAGAALLLPSGYTVYSVGRYFGFERALGGDHFRVGYRTTGLVDEGAFRWTPNAMYTFAFLGPWSLAFLLGSQAALAAATFQHAFVWAHYLGTERPDMELIYGSRAPEE